MSNQPIEEKWSKEFFEKFGANKIWVVPSKENVETILDIWSFIENLLEQERQRMSDEVKKLGYSVGELDKYVKGDVKDAYHDGFMTAKDKVKAIINK